MVVLHNHAVKEKWVKDWYSDLYTLEKNLISIWVNGMEIFIEFSGSSGYFVDILVKSSKPYQETMEFLSPNIVGIIRELCASQEGCQGVTLVEAIIRPECLYGADEGNPILCAHRRDQSVLVEELTNKLTSSPDWEHCWDKVEDGAGGLVLDEGQDSVTLLLEGTKGVAPGPEPNYTQLRVKEVCYPNKNRKLGKSRGLAMIVSMESGRPGAGVDRGSLKTLALACGFSPVQQEVDQEASELIDTIKYVAESSILEEEDEAFMCFINGHGHTQEGQSYIMDKNKEKIMVIRDIIEPFRQSKHLLGKPKIFFVNCCRGMKLHDNSSAKEADYDDHGAHDGQDDQQGIGSLPPLEEVSDCFAHDGHDDQQGIGSLLPPLEEVSDCLLVFSTAEGCRSCRHKDTGTMFVETLVETVMEQRETMDVLTMMTMVNERVTKSAEFTSIGGWHQSHNWPMLRGEELFAKKALLAVSLSPLGV